jgi:hypothetical protein
VGAKTGENGMDRRDQRFIRILEEMKNSFSDQFSEKLNELDKEFSIKGYFEKLSVGMAVQNDAGLIGVVQKIDGPHYVVVKYEQSTEVHCLDDACFHYDPVKPV